MSEPPLDGGPGQPEQGDSADHPSPDDGAAEDSPRRGSHRAGGRPTPPPPPPAGAPYWPQPDYQPDEPLKRPLAETLPLRLLQGGMALILVIILVFVLFQVFKPSKTTDEKPTAASSKPPAGSSRTTPAKTSGAPGAATSAAPGTTSAPVTQPAGTTTAKPTKKPTSKPTSSKPTTKPPTTKAPTTKPTTKPPTTKPPVVAPPPVDVKAPLLVLNNSRIHGLAQVGRDAFAKGGWTVTGTGNYSGRLPQTTVFYSPGLKAAAETLARQFPSVTVVKPRPAGVPGSSLTVVLTRYFKP
jgi:outer membrane biosynthesis protein TonB